MKSSMIITKAMVVGLILILSSFGVVQMAFAGGSVTNAQIKNFDVDECAVVGDTVTVSADLTAATPPGQLSQYGYVIYWGDGQEYDSGTGFFTSTSTFSVEQSHTYTAAATNTITIAVYHQSPNGQDGNDQAEFDLTLCVVDPEPTTGTIVVQKNVVNSTVATSTFSFTVNGGTATTFEADGSNEVTVVLADAPYTVVEVNANGTGYTTTYNNCAEMSAGATCTITNTYSTSTTPTTTATGTVTVTKVFSADGNPNESALSDFGFTVNGAATTTFDEMTGQGTVMNVSGSYEIREVGIVADLADWEVSYSEGCAGVMTASGTSCTITNTYNPDVEPPVFCDNEMAANYDEEGECLYRVFGTVWNDVDEDGVETEAPEEDEAGIVGRTVTINNGVQGEGYQEFATTTDENGNYEFLVPAGTWTISDGETNDTEQTYPINEGNLHVVTVPGESEETVLSAINEENENFVTAFLNWLIPTAYAQVAPASGFGPFNFGNVTVEESRNSSSGTRVGDRRDGSSADGAPTPQVLGESTSVMPVGAPNTGHGGTAPVTATLPSIVAILSSLRGVQKVK